MLTGFETIEARHVDIFSEQNHFPNPILPRDD